jgi:hypothetical protein
MNNAAKATAFTLDFNKALQNHKPYYMRHGHATKIAAVPTLATSNW